MILHTCTVDIYLCGINIYDQPLKLIFVYYLPWWCKLSSDLHVSIHCTIWTFLSAPYQSVNARSSPSVSAFYCMKTPWWYLFFYLETVFLFVVSLLVFIYSYWRVFNHLYLYVWMDACVYRGIYMFICIYSNLCSVLYNMYWLYFRNDSPSQCYHWHDYHHYQCADYACGLIVSIPIDKSRLLFLFHLIPIDK